MNQDKAAVRHFLGAASCGEVYAGGDTAAGRFANQAQARYALEPYIRDFARFDGSGKDVLEVGVGMGADHRKWAKSGSRCLVGVDLTAAADWTRERFELAGLSPRTLVPAQRRDPRPYRDMMGGLSRKDRLEAVDEHRPFVAELMDWACLAPTA